MTNQLSQIIAAASCVGFSGTRALNNHLRAIVTDTVNLAVAVMPGTIYVGDAAGVDLAVCDAVPADRLAIFAVPCGAGRGAFASRSIRCVSAVAWSAHGLWVSFPSGTCPAVLIPSPKSNLCFCGAGSGSWASLAYALGLGLACLVYLGDAPAPSGWPLAPVADSPGWWHAPSVIKSNLFN